jgi:DNA-directed RNA polymerase subunit K
MKVSEFTKYERARILGARALQIAMNAPLLIKISQEDLEKINFDALKIAEIEFESEVLPISVNRPMPQKVESRLKRAKPSKVADKEKQKLEEEEEKEIVEEGEIMKIANPDDDDDQESSEEEKEE